MRVLFLSSEFPNPCDPTKAIFNLDIVNRLRAAHDVRVICPVSWVHEWRARRRNAPMAAAGDQAPSEVRWITYPRYWYTPLVFRRWYGAFFRWSVADSLRRVCRNWRPDVVLSYWAHPDGYVAGDFAHRRGVPCVLITGGSDVLVITEQSARSRVVRTALERADLVLTVSEHLRSTVLRLGLPEDRVGVLRRGIDTQSFSPGARNTARRKLGLAEQGHVLLWVGRLVPVKAVDSLIAAFAQLADRSVRLFLIGGGPERETLERLARSLEVAERVTFVGSVSRSALPDWYRAADLTVLSSQSEGLPNVLLESAACGTPFIATDVGGVSEVCEPGFDLLVPTGDTDALARAIAARLLSPPHRPRASRVPSAEDSTSQLAAYLSAAVSRQRGATLNVSAEAV